MATNTKRHPLTKSQAVSRRDGPPSQWPSYTGTAQFVGTSLNGRVTVYVDPTLGQPGHQNAQDLVNDADRIVAANDNDFFGTPGGPVNVIIFAFDGKTDGTGGADHNGCDYQTGADIEVCASFGQPARVSALFEAELSECSMGGNLCGVSTGEALSRWCAAVVSNNALADFASAPDWAQAGMPDFVTKTDPTDRNSVSTGCGMVFLSWLLSQGHDLSKIAPAMVSLGDNGTLAQLYAELTGNPASQALAKFMAAVHELPGDITNDDPFGSAAPSASMTQLSPALIAMAGKVFGAILADLAQGKADHQIVASVRAILSADAVGNPCGSGSRPCGKTSHRLRPA